MWDRLSPAAHAAALGWVVADRLSALSALTRRHPDGVVLRLPRRRLVLLARPEEIKHVLVDNARGYTKGLGQAEAAGWFGGGVLTAEGLAWFEQRESVGELLAARRVQKLLPDLTRTARCSVSGLGSEDWAILDPRAHVARYTTEVLALALGLAHLDVDAASDAFAVLQRQVMFETTTQQLLPGWARPVHRRMVRRHRTHLEALARVALRDRPDDAAPWATPERLLTLWLAGYETTAATLAWALSFLASRPDVQQRIAEEAHAVLDHPTPGHPPALPTALAVFRETVRLHPPVWLVSRRALEDDRVGENRVRRGDDVAVCVHALQRRVADPETFDPDRPREGGSLAFGQGPRACPGASLADLEATLWLALACRDLELEPAGSPPPRPVALLSQTPSAFAVRVRRRVRSAAAPDRTPVPASG